jgi:hypothetical protein
LKSNRETKKGQAIIKMMSPLFFEPTDLNHAIRFLSSHPSMRLLRERGGWEIPPAADLAGMIEESVRRRGLTSDDFGN